MAFPERERIKSALLDEIRRRGGSVRPREVYDPLADFFRLPPSDRDRAKLDGSSRWENEVNWARFELAEEGKIDRSQHGVWKLK
jgi:restriction endonuclease Mrr